MYSIYSIYSICRLQLNRGLFVMRAMRHNQTVTKDSRLMFYQLQLSGTLPLTRVGLVPKTIAASDILGLALHWSCAYLAPAVPSPTKRYTMLWPSVPEAPSQLQSLLRHTSRTSLQHLLMRHCLGSISRARFRASIMALDTRMNEVCITRDSRLSLFAACNYH